MSVMTWDRYRQPYWEARLKIDGGHALVPKGVDKYLCRNCSFLVQGKVIFETKKFLCDYAFDVRGKPKPPPSTFMNQYRELFDEKGEWKPIVITIDQAFLEASP